MGRPDPPSPSSGGAARRRWRQAARRHKRRRSWAGGAPRAPTAASDGAAVLPDGDGLWQRERGSASSAVGAEEGDGGRRGSTCPVTALVLSSRRWLSPLPSPAPPLSDSVGWRKPASFSSSIAFPIDPTSARQPSSPGGPTATASRRRGAHRWSSVVSLLPLHDSTEQECGPWRLQT